MKKRVYGTVLAVMLFCAAGFPLFGQNASSLPTEKACIALCDEIMGLIVEKDYDAAFSKLRDVSVPQLRDSVYELRNTTRNQLAGIRPQFGNEIDFVHVSTENIKGVLLKIIYIERFQNHGLRWEFIFYNSGGGFRLDNIFWNDELSRLFRGESSD